MAETPSLAAMAARLATAPVSNSTIQASACASCRVMRGGSVGIGFGRALRLVPCTVNRLWKFVLVSGLGPHAASKNPVRTKLHRYRQVIVCALSNKRSSWDPKGNCRSEPHASDQIVADRATSATTAKPTWHASHWLGRSASHSRHGVVTGLPRRNRRSQLEIDSACSEYSETHACFVKRVLRRRWRSRPMATRSSAIRRQIRGSHNRLRRQARQLLHESAAYAHRRTRRAGY